MADKKIGFFRWRGSRKMKDAAEVEKSLFVKRSEESRQGRRRDDSHGDKSKNFCLTVCDRVFVSTVVLANVVGFWRGLFGILSHFHNPYHLIFLFLLGSFLHFQFTFAKNTYKRYLIKKNPLNSVLRKGYTYAFGSACVIQWAGLWYYLDEMTGYDVYPPLTYSIICSAILMWIKLYRNVLAPPVTFCSDRLHEFFEFKTVFKMNLSKKPSSDTSLYVLDCFFSVFVIGSLVVFVWRGVWCLTDIFLYPDDDKYSAFGSLVIGYCILIVVFSLQTPMESFCEKLTGVWRILAADVYVFVSFIGTINLWRGFWNLLNIYFLPDFPVLSCWITHFGSFAFLVLINCSNSILVRGVYLDGEEGGNCVAFPISYLKLLFEEQLQKNAEKTSINHKVTSLTNLSAEAEKAPKENPEISTVEVQVNDSSLEVKS